MLGCFSLVYWGNWNSDTKSKFFNYELRDFVPFDLYTHTLLSFCPFSYTPSSPSFYFKDPQLESWGSWPQCLCAFCKQHIVALTRELANQTWACVSSQARDIWVLKRIQKAFSLKKHTRIHHMLSPEPFTISLLKWVYRSETQRCVLKTQNCRTGVRSRSCSIYEITYQKCNLACFSNGI